MKEYAPNEIRNVGLVAHQSAGKTTLADAMAFSTGATNRIGSIDDGTTISDYRSDEIDRKISISTSLLTLEWKKNKINLIDMPGYMDFIGDVRCGLRVTDLAVVVVNSQNGVEVGTDLAWEILDEFKTPRLLFVNLCDREHSKFDQAVEHAKEAYGNNVIVVQFPANEGEGFNSVVDVLLMKKLTFAADGSGKVTVEDIPGDLADKAEELRMELVEKIAEADEEIMEKYFEEGDLTEEEIVNGLKAGLISNDIYPVLCGAGQKNAGAQPLMDFIVKYGPSPCDMPPIHDAEDNEIACDTSAGFTAFTFKTMSEKHVGELSLIRVFSGSVKSGDDAMNTSVDKTEKIGQMYALTGKNRSELSNLPAGDIGALVKLKNTHTGNTLADKKGTTKFKTIAFPEPVVQVAVLPKNKGDEDKISSGLHTLHEIDPSFTVFNDAELKQTVVSGQGEMHLTVIMERLKERYGVEIIQKKPKIAYRETITAKADEKYRHKKQSGGAGQFGEVWMRIEPQPRGAGYEFESQVVGGAISQAFIPSVDKGIQQILVDGAIAGYKIVDVKAIVYDGKEHPVDSKDIAFQIAGRECFKLCMKSAKPILLEPIYNIEIKCPEEYMGDVMGDLSSRRGKIMGMDAVGRFQIVKAQVPLAELSNYATSLRSFTQGRATHTRTFSHYDPLPKDQEAKVIAESQADDEE